MIRLEAYVTFEERFCFKLFLGEVKSSESVQVKLIAFEIKIQFTILLENFEQDFRLLTNDLSNSFKTKESMAQDYSDNNRSRKFEHEPFITVMLRSIFHWTKFPDNISKLFLNKKKRNECFPLTLQRSSKAVDRFRWSLIMGIPTLQLQPGLIVIY